VRNCPHCDTTCDAILTAISYWGVFWVDVSNRSTAQNGFAAVAKALGLTGQTVEESLQALANSTRRWLLVLDNADDATFDYSVYLPSGNRGAVIMTSRVPACSKYSTLEPEALEGLELLYSTQLLLKAARLPKDSWSSHTAQAQEIVQLLGSHTLALIQAGAYIAEGYCRLSQYAEKFRKQRRQLLEHHPDQAKSRYQNVYATFEASLEGLMRSGDEAGQDALDLLATVSMLHSSILPLMVFQDAWTGARMLLDHERRIADSIAPEMPPSRSWRARLLGKKFKQSHIPPNQDAYTFDVLTNEHISRLLRLVGTERVEWNDYRLKKAVATLASLSLVTRHQFEEDDGISMHPLAHAWARDRLEPSQQEKTWVSTACLFAMGREKSTRWKAHERELLPHIQSFFSFDPRTVLSYGPQRMMLPLLVHCGWVILAVSDLRRLQTLLEVIYEEIGVTAWNIPKQHMSLILLASKSALYLRQTRLAIALLEHIDKVQMATLENKRNLAHAYNDNGDAEKAAALLENYIKTYKTMPSRGENLNVLAETQSELSRAYNLNGQPEKAVALLQEVVDSHQPALQTVANHGLLRSQHALAIAYLANGQKGDAVALLEQVVKTYETLLDEAHPSRLSAEQELARAYDANGQLEKSLPILENVVRIRETSLEDTDYSLLISQYSLAYTYSHLSQHKKALELREHIVNVYRTILEETQPDRLMAEYALSLTYIDTKQPEKALELMRHVVKIRKTTLEYEHPQRRESERLLGVLEAGTA
jgi:tetratricopeptide (TPR) repeat protein